MNTSHATASPEITLYSLSAYNAGVLISRTFDLSDMDSHADYWVEVAAWLEDLTKSTGRLHEEWIVADYEGMPAGLVGEYDIDPAYWRLKPAIDAHGLDRVNAYLKYFDLKYCPDDISADIDDRYCGTADSDAAFAQDLVESCGDIPTDLPPYIYIDWESTARDIMHDYLESNGHYFRTC